MVSTKGPIFWSKNYSTVYSFDPKSLWRRISLRDQRLMIADIIVSTIGLLDFPANGELVKLIERLRTSQEKERLSYLRQHPIRFGRALARKIFSRS
jgi:hypothetical protein